MRPLNKGRISIFCAVANKEEEKVVLFQLKVNAFATGLTLL